MKLRMRDTSKVSELQTDLRPLEEQQAKLERLVGAQERLFAVMKFRPDMKFDGAALTIVRDRAEKEHGKKSFEEKAADLYVDFFEIYYGFEMWHDREAQIKGVFLKALNGEKK